MRLVLFFTWDVSLEVWEKKGLLQRELKLYEHLVEHGVEVVLVTWGGERDKEIAKNYRGFKVIPIYSYLPHPKNKIARFLISFFAPFFLKDAIDTQTVLKTNQMWGGWVALVARYLYRKPLLVRTGFELYDFTLRGGYGFLRRAFIWTISALTYRAADHLFLATLSDSKFVQKHFSVPAGKITICPNWIDTDLFSPGDGRKQHLLYVGRLNAQKNLPALIDAVSATPYKLQIVGSGELEKDLRRRSSEYGDKIEFLGALPNNELPALYRDCAIYILPSHYEGNPKTLLEAMACGAAVIATNVPGIRDVIYNKETGILCQTDAKDIETAIVSLMKQPDLRQGLGNRAREAIIANNTLAAQVERELKSLRRLAQPEHI